MTPGAPAHPWTGLHAALTWLNRDPAPAPVEEWALEDARRAWTLSTTTQRATLEAGGWDVDLLPVPVAAPTAWQPAAAHRYLWPPRCIATGVGPAAASPRLTGTHVLIYLALLDASDNATREHTVNAAGIAARAGCTEKTVLRAIRGPLATSALIQILRSGSGAQVRVRVAVGTGRDRLVLPVAVIWPQQGRLRWSTDAGLAIRALLAILGVLDHKATNTGGRVDTTLPAEAIATRARTSRSQYLLGLAVILGAGPATGTARNGGWATRIPAGAGTWISATARTAPDRKGRLSPDGRVMRVQDTTAITVSWDALPTQLTPVKPEKVEIPDAGKVEIPDAGKVEIPDAGKVEIPDGFTSGTPVLQVLLPSGAPSLQAASVSTVATGSAREGGREGGRIPVLAGKKAKPPR